MKMNILKFGTIACLTMLLAAKPSPKKTLKPDADNGGIKLPAGFGAVVIAEETGKARHLIVLPNGNIYVKLNKLQDGKGILMLKDTDGDGKADVRNTFGSFKGTGVEVYKNYLNSMTKVKLKIQQHQK
jgi:hypothetical protein